jgi:hypothetical protein
VYRVVDGNFSPIRFDELRFDDLAMLDLSLAQDLELVAGKVVELGCVGRGDEADEGLPRALLLRGWQSGRPTVAS